MARLTVMRNIGPKSSKWLHAVGIRTRDDLAEVGAVGAFLMVCGAGFCASQNLLWALHGPLHDKDWRALTEREKKELRDELSSASTQQSNSISAVIRGVN